MAWIRMGNCLYNTNQICFIERKGEVIRLVFTAFTSKLECQDDAEAIVVLDNLYNTLSNIT